jgi:hypothetical protein
VATMGDVAVKVRYPDGHEQDLQDAMPHADPGQYYVNIVWGVHHVQARLRSNGSIGRIAELRFIGSLEKRQA